MSRRRTSNEPGRVLVLSGPSGVGKTTVAERLVAVVPRLERVVTVTTRLPRPGEVDGVHYRFVSPEVFARLREGGKLLEWAEVHGAFYGTPREAVAAIRHAGKDALLVIDVQGARQVKRSVPEAILVFLAPPDEATLAARLRARGTEAGEALARRLKAARVEMGAAPEFDHQVVNGELEATVATLKRLLGYE